MKEAYNVIKRMSSRERHLLALYQKMLKKYDLSFYRLMGRGEYIAFDFYTTLNDIIQKFTIGGGINLYCSHGIFYSLNIDGSVFKDNRNMSISVVRKKSYMKVFKYSFNLKSLKDEDYIRILILITLISKIDVLLCNHGEDIDHYYMIKRFLLSVIKITDDLHQFLTYKNNRLVLKAFYGLHGFKYYKHLLCNSVPKDIFI